MNLSLASNHRSSVTIADLIQGLNLSSKLSQPLSELVPTDVTLDSRKVQKGGVFIAVPGESTDGRQYVNSAIDSGALAVLIESQNMPADCGPHIENGNAVALADLNQSVSTIAARFFHHPSKQLKITGITGTNGKTTCAYLLTQALDLLGENSAMMGTLGIGRLDNLLGSSLTTSDAVETQRKLFELLDSGIQAVSMEVSSHGLVQSRVSSVEFDVAIFTNLSQDHLDFHGNLESYAAAKKSLFEFPELRSMVVNVEDSLGKEIIDIPFSGTKISYGWHSGDITPSAVRTAATGVSFELNWGRAKFPVQSKLCGEFNVSNLMAVFGALQTMGFDTKNIVEVLPMLKSPPGRMEQFRGDDSQPLVVVDFSHTPDSLTKALQTLKSHTVGKLVVVFGCGGDRDKGKRSLMGAAAAKYADHIFVTNDNPRSESPEDIADQAVQGVKATNPDKPIKVLLDRKTAIATAISLFDFNDTVLIAGKGHEETQTIGSEVLPFSDRAVVSEILGGAL